MSGHATGRGATLGGRTGSRKTNRERITGTQDPEVLRIKHDLRQPLAAIVWSLEAMHDADDLPMRHRIALEQIERDAHWMSRLLTEAFGTQAKVSVVDLGDSVAGSCSTTPTSAPYDVVFTQAGETPVLVDPVELQRAARNLMDNAMRAVADGGRIEVDVSSVGGRGVLQVGDSGPGFGGLSPRHGLGLVGVRRFVERFGGDLAFGTSSLGGALVQLSLPRAFGW